MRIVRISAGQNWLANGGKMQFPLDFVPSNYRVEAAFIEGDLTMDVPAAGVTSEQQTLLLDSYESERRLRGTGIGESCADWCLNGKDVVRPAALAVGNGQGVKLFWPIGFRDPRSIEPQDSSPAGNFYKGKALDVYLRKPADLVAGWVITAGTAQLVVFLSPLPVGVIPQSIIKGYVEVIGKEVKLPPGRYVDLFMVKNDGAVITEAELGNVQLTRDSIENILEKTRTPQLARQFNYFVAKGTTAQAASAEGEALPNSGSLPFAPFITQDEGFKATKLHWAREQLLLTFDGTLAPNIARVFYRIVEPMDEVASAKAAVKLGIPVDEGTVFHPKTASKNGIPEGTPFRAVAGVLARRVGRR